MAELITQPIRAKVTEPRLRGIAESPNACCSSSGTSMLAGPCSAAEAEVSPRRFEPRQSARMERLRNPRPGRVSLPLLHYRAQKRQLAAGPSACLPVQTGQPGRKCRIHAKASARRGPDPTPPLQVSPRCRPQRLLLRGCGACGVFAARPDTRSRDNRAVSAVWRASRVDSRTPASRQSGLSHSARVRQAFQR